MIHYVLICIGLLVHSQESFLKEGLYYYKYPTERGSKIICLMIHADKKFELIEKIPCFYPKYTSGNYHFNLSKSSLILSYKGECLPSSDDRKSKIKGFKLESENGMLVELKPICYNRVAKGTFVSYQRLEFKTDTASVHDFQKLKKYVFEHKDEYLP